MSVITPDRIAELWPALSREARRKIAQIVEAETARDAPLDLSDEEERLLAQARADFKHGRALDTDEYHAEMTGFMQGLAAKSAS
jgi:hypothetical protein